MEINYQTIYEYLHCGKYPAGSSVNQKRATRNKARKFVIKDGVLHYIAKDGLRQWITETHQQRKIIQACHADKLGGHFGRDKTRQKIASRFAIIAFTNGFLTLLDELLTLSTVQLLSCSRGSALCILQTADSQTHRLTNSHRKFFAVTLHMQQLSNYD